MTDHARRRFLKVLAGSAGALVVGVAFAPADAATPPWPLPPDRLGDDYRDLGLFVRIDGSGDVLIGAREPETGTGCATAIARIIADELDADWQRVGVLPLGLATENRDGRLTWPYGHQLGGMGESVPAAWADLRQAGALARWLLLEAAARRFGIAADRLRSEAGQVIAPDGRRLDYGALAADAARIDPPEHPVPLKSPERYGLIGRPAGDADAHAIVTGTLRFASDTYWPETLVAVLARCPWPDGELAALDAAPALAVKGVVKVVPLKPDPHAAPGETPLAPAVAVIATDTWAALQGRDKLKPVWKPGPSGSEDSTALEQRALALLEDKTATGITVRNDGDVQAASKKAARRFEATYVLPWLAHATPEPMHCLVRLEKDRVTLLLPTQAPQQAFAVVQRLTGLRPEQIEIQVPRMGGGYGRRLEHDYLAEALLLARETAGKPLKLLWTRADDLGHDYYRPGAAIKLAAVLDRKRNVIAWSQRTAGASSLTGRGVSEDRLWTSELSADQLPAGLVPHYRSDWYALQTAMPRGMQRGMPHLSQAFAVESFIDELAHQLKENPLDTRLRLLGEPRQIPLGDGRVLDTGRLRAVLVQAAERLGWKQNWLHSVNGLGLACWRIGDAYVAHALEVALEGETLRIVRAVCAVDVGRVINPTGLEGQVAGATLDALGTALNLAVTFKDGRIQQTTYRDYPLAGMAQLPREVEVIVVPGENRAPSGASFLAMPTAAPALANAVFRVSAVRVRRLPLMREFLRLL